VSGKACSAGAAVGRTAAQAVAVMSFAVERGLREDNPVRGVKKPPRRRLERFLSEVDIARLGEALAAEVETTGDPYSAAAIRLLLLTGCRRSEILGWDWIDFERAMIFPSACPIAP
jgi:integrase